MKLTPISIRLAYSFFQKLFDKQPLDFGPYDTVEIFEVSPMDKLKVPILGIEYGSIIRVAFYNNKRCVKYVDFSILPSGGIEEGLQLIESEIPDES